MNTNDTEPQKHSTGARILVALGFGGIGAKLGIIGTAIDAHQIVGGKEGWSLLRNQEGRAQVMEKAMERVQKAVDQGKNPMVASFGLFKYTWIFTGVLVAAGSILGWMRGGLIADWKDIFKHPWRSTKIILGFEKPPEQKAAEAKPVDIAVQQQVAQIPQPAPEASVQWTQKIGPKEEPVTQPKEIPSPKVTQAEVLAQQAVNAPNAALGA